MIQRLLMSIGILSSVLPVSGSAQENPIAALEQTLAKDMPDSVRVRNAIELSRAYQFVDFDKSFEYARMATTLADTINAAWAKAASYMNLAYCYTLNGDFSTALKYNNLALQSSLQAKDSLLLAESYKYIGNDYYDIGEYDDAYFYFTQSYSVARRIQDSLNMAIALHNVGRVFKELGEYDRALNHLALSLKISQQIGDRPGLPYYYDEFGDVQIRMGNYDSALNAMHKSLVLVNNQELGELKPRTFTKLASIHMNKNEFEKAFAYYDSTYALYAKTNNKFGLAQLLLGRGIVHLRSEDFENAHASFEEALALARSINARTLEIECHKNLYAIWELQGDYQKALESLKQYEAIEDSIFSQEMLQNLYRDQMRFETEAKDLQIANLSLLDARQKDALKREEFIRNILAVVFALSMILLLTVYRSGQRRKQINELLVKHQDETARRSEELERLNQVKDKFFSIISHDLRSPLNALSGILDIMSKGGLSQEEFEEQTRELRARFNHTRTLLNNLLDWTLLQMDKLSLQATRISLRKIVDENVQLLSSLQAKKISLINAVPDEAIGYADSNTINLVIRNLMTNAIKFTNEGGVVTIDSAEDAKAWTISVHDNGIGINKDVQQILFDKTSPYTTRGTANEKGTGLGLILCKEFVEKNGGRIWVDSEEGKGSVFRFTVPKPQSPLAV